MEGVKHKSYVILTLLKILMQKMIRTSFFDSQVHVLLHLVEDI